MRIVLTYLVKMEKGNAWLAPGKEIPEGATIIEERPVLFPDDGFVLQNKESEERFESIWLRGGDTEENYIEVENKEE